METHKSSIHSVLSSATECLGGLWAQIPGVLGIFLKMHHHRLALLFFQALFHSAMDRRQKLALGLTPHGDFHPPYQCDGLSTCDCVWLSDSKMSI